MAIQRDCLADIAERTAVTLALRHRRTQPVNALENNRHPVELLDLVNSAS